MARRLIPVLLALVLPIGCEPAPPPPVTGNGVCDPPTLDVSLPRALQETSGVAVSRSYPDVLWTHNDSGGDSVVFALDTTGALIGRVRIRGATNRDWEDVALGPCRPGGPSCLFVGDIGDNKEVHPRIAIYRVPEPDPRTDTISARATVLRATFPGGPRNAESLYVNDAGIHVITKGWSGAVEIFRIRPPYQPGRTVELEPLQRLAPPPTSVSAQVTAAAVTADDREAVVRTYADLHFYHVEADTLVPFGRPAEVAAPDQMQGEGVDFLPDGRLVLTSEAQGNRPASLVIVRCDPLRPPPDTATDSSRTAPAHGG